MNVRTCVSRLWPNGLGLTALAFCPATASLARLSQTTDPRLNVRLNVRLTGDHPPSQITPERTRIIVTYVRPYGRKYSTLLQIARKTSHYLHGVAQTMLCVSFSSSFCSCRNRRALNTYVRTYVYIKADVVLLGSVGVFCAWGNNGREGGGLARTIAGKTLRAMAARKATVRSTRPVGPVPKTKPQVLFAKYHCQSLLLGRGWVELFGLAFELV